MRCSKKYKSGLATRIIWTACIILNAFLSSSFAHSEDAKWLGKSDFFNLMFGKDFATASALEKEIVEAVTLVEGCREDRFQLDDNALERGETIKDEYSRKTIFLFQMDILIDLGKQTIERSKQGSFNPIACERAMQWARNKKWIEPEKTNKSEARVAIEQCVTINECRRRAYADGYLPVISPFEAMMCGKCKKLSK